MPLFEVEVHGTSREVYMVEADSADHARREWDTGSIFVSEIDNCEVVSVKEAQ